jgi:hypothetical protein
MKQLDRNRKTRFFYGQRIAIAFLSSFLWVACQSGAAQLSATVSLATPEMLIPYATSSQQETPTVSPEGGLFSPTDTKGTITSGESSTGTVYYVRPDGGAAGQCNGLHDAPYSEGVSPACAWSHPFWALPPQGSPRIAGGDTLMIASGEYRMGLGAPGTGDCDAAGGYDCHMPSIPGGPDAAHPTRILGEGWATGCLNPPSLWGSERAGLILNLNGSRNMIVACLEITDHSECVESQENGFPCERDSPPYGDWASIGLSAEDSENVLLANLNIHGLASDGVRAGRLADWTVQDMRIAGNGWSGWNGDIGEHSSNSGTLTFRRWRVEWNGCGETYPGGRPTRCWAQSAGGYGDGVGTGLTGGRWIIEDSAFLHNTSDGLDLLYARLPGAKVEIRRSIFEGNAGNQIKTTGPTTMENVIAVGNCTFFDHQPFTYRLDAGGDGTPGAGSVDPCRAGGDTVALDLNPGDQARVVNSTLTGEGACIVIAVCAYQKDCAGTSQSVELANDIFEGNPSFFASGEDVCFAWFNDEGGGDRLPRNPFETIFSILYGVRFGNVQPCPGGNNRCGVPAGILSVGIDAFDAHLLPGSSAIDAGKREAAPQTDFDGRLRDARPDIGAYEWR